MKHIKHLFAVCLLLLVATTATAQSQSDNTQTKAVSATKADVNGDGVVNEADIEEILAIMQQENGTKYYWYAGWTEPTAENIAEIINEEYPTDETNTSTNKAGKSATTTLGIEMDYTVNPIWDPEFISSGYEKERIAYIVIPNGHSLYDIIGTNITAQNGGAFIKKHSEFNNHTVWVTKNVLCASDSFIIK
jgi:uncharacterized membrane protein